MPDEVLMKDISRRRHEALNELYGRHSKDCARQLTALFMKSPKLTMFYRKFFSRFGKRQVVIQPKQASRSDGWSPSPAVERSTGCAAARLIRVRESAMSSESCKIRRARVATRRNILVLNDLRRFLKKNIRALPQFQREAVELAFFKGLSHREIAAATHAPLGTVKTRLELGLQKLTHALRPLRHKV